MKITEKYLKKIISEEIDNIFEEIENPRKQQMFEFFLNLYKAYKADEKYYNKKLKPADVNTDYKQILADGIKETGMNATDLYDELYNFEGEIDQNMFEVIRDILTAQMLYDDKDDRIGTEDKEDLEKGMYDRFKNYHGKPDVRLVDDDE